MCGIAGYLSPDRSSQRSVIDRLLSRMRHRGEAHLQTEVHCDDWGGLGCNRLAIMSEDVACQPLQTRNGFVTGVYNGEVYNYRALATQLANVPSCESIAGGDGPIVMEYVAQRGMSGVRELDGMFALVWHDSRYHTVYFARDPFGIKPLYYAHGRGGLYIASEIKALAAESTIREIYEALPGQIYEVALNGSEMYRVNASRYAEYRSDGLDDSVNVSQLTNAIERSVELCCECPHRIGVYLSGGVDSSAVFAIASRLGHRPIALTLAGRGGVDSPHAVALAEDLGEDLVKSHVPDEMELFERIDDTIAIVESFEPNVVRQSSVQYFISELARRACVKVALCGEGADELFCGYPEFVSTGQEWESLRRAFLADLYRTQLQRVDRMSMHFTTEVRVPFLMDEIVKVALGSSQRSDFMEGTASRVTVKACLRAALGGILPDRWRLRPKVVLSEGVGLGGNDPTTGMFARLAEARVDGATLREVKREFPDWGIRSAEEALYFLRFHACEYTKASCLKRRVVANRVHSRLY